MSDILFFLIVIAIFLTPILTRVFFEFFQVLFGIACIIAIVFYPEFTFSNRPVLPVLFFVMWVIGSLYALGMRSRELAIDLKREHEYEYHSKGNS